MRLLLATLLLLLTAVSAVRTILDIDRKVSSLIDPSTEPGLGPSGLSELPRTLSSLFDAFPTPDFVYLDHSLNATLPDAEAAVLLAEIAEYESHPVELRANPLKCTTKSSSPPVAFAHQAAKIMEETYSKMALCPQHSKGGCVRYGQYMDAAIAICGPRFHKVRCYSLSWAARHISNNCKNNNDGKAAGKYHFEEAGVWAILTSLYV